MEKNVLSAFSPLLDLEFLPRPAFEGTARSLSQFFEEKSFFRSRQGRHIITLFFIKLD